MNNNKGISMITLIVTIIVMLILIGVVGGNSFDTIEKSYEAVDSKEITDVVNFVLNQQMAVEMDNFKTFPSIEITPEELYLVVDKKLNNTQLNNIIDVNTSNLEAKYKYYYVQASEKYFESTEFVREGISVQDVKRDYIINFYTGTVIIILDNEVKVNGIIKGLDEIMSEI